MKTITVQRPVFLTLMDELGYKNPAKMSAKIAAKRLQGLASKITDETEITDPDADALATEVLAALAEGDVEFKLVKAAAPVEEAPVEEAEEAPVAKPKKSKKTPKQLAAEKPTKAAAPTTPKALPIPGVRPTRSRPFLAGVVIAKHGIDKGITDEMVKEIDDLYMADGNGSNLRETKFSARNAWAAVRGFKYGDDVMAGVKMSATKAAKEEADAAAE